MKLYQMRQEEASMISSGTLTRTSMGRRKANTDKVPTNLSPSVLMTYLRTLTSTARTDMPVTEDTLMNTPGPTADIKDTFKVVLEPGLSMICLMILRECLLLTDTPNRLKTSFMVHRNSTVEQ